jgi:uncharacterized protein
MQFVVIAYDYTDEDALNRRLNCRQEHIDTISRLKQQGHMIHGGAILSDSGQMQGSIIVADFPSRNELDAWLEAEPYIRNRVWERITVHAYQTGPSFLPATV